MLTDVTVSRGDPIDRIAPGIYGHFAEHLGRCIYGGVWVGDGAAVETVDGFRADTLALLENLETPVLRWPGGCFADDYHWEDGVGPREERPRRRNLWWAQGRSELFEEPNDFGTDEFLALCERIDAEPYIAANVGSGSPGEAADWAEYCNSDGNTELTGRRRANGHEEPHGVPYWGVGNENWGCGGRYGPGEYARAYRNVANYLSAVDGALSTVSMELVACGHTSDDWNRRFLEALVDEPGSTEGLVDHLSVHRYYSAGGDTDFSDEQYYRLFADARKIGRDVDRAAGAIEAYPAVGEVGVIVDEWGVWHPEATSENGLEQANTVRDALVAAGTLDLLNARADVVTMANLAQTVNVLQCLVETDEGAAWPTPTYRVFDRYTGHAGATALPTVVDADCRKVEEEPFDVPLVSASASEHEGEVFVTASNRHLDDAASLRIDAGLAEPTVEEATVLFGDADVRDASSADSDGEFRPDDATVESSSDGTVTVEVPPASVADVTLAES